MIVGTIIAYCQLIPGRLHFLVLHMSSTEGTPFFCVLLLSHLPKALPGKAMLRHARRMPPHVIGCCVRLPGGGREGRAGIGRRLIWLGDVDLQRAPCHRKLCMWTPGCGNNAPGAVRWLIWAVRQRVALQRQQPAPVIASHCHAASADALIRIAASCHPPISCR